MKKKELFDYVIRYFEEAMPIAETELEYGNAFELIVAVILSAQCTDKRVNHRITSYNVCYTKLLRLAAR